MPSCHANNFSYRSFRENLHHVPLNPIKNAVAMAQIHAFPIRHSKISRLHSQPAKSSSPALPSLGTYRILLSSNTLKTSSGSVPTTFTA